MEQEAVEPRTNRKEQERERRRLRDRERRQSMNQEERERHLARRRKNYQLRRQRADEICRLEAITALTSPPDSGSTCIPLAESDYSVGIQVEEVNKLLGNIRLSRLKHLARTLNKSSTASDADAIRKETTDSKTRLAMSSGLRLSRVKQLVRSKGQHDGSHSQTQGLQLH